MRSKGTSSIGGSYQPACALTLCASLGEIQGLASIDSSARVNRDSAAVHEEYDSFKDTDQPLSDRTEAFVQDERAHGGAPG
jgi:hypothetical protein